VKVFINLLPSMCPNNSASYGTYSVAFDACRETIKSLFEQNRNSRDCHASWRTRKDGEPPSPYPSAPLPPNRNDRYRPLSKHNVTPNTGGQDAKHKQAGIPFYCYDPKIIHGRHGVPLSHLSLEARHGLFTNLSLARRAAGGNPKVWS
jgi:hypothetical protein